MRVSPVHVTFGLVVGFILGCVGAPPSSTDTSPTDNGNGGGNHDTDTGNGNTDTGDTHIDTGDTQDLDGDNDGYDRPDDCDDSNPKIHPGAKEVCDDGDDNNCDGEVDEGCGGGIDTGFATLEWHLTGTSKGSGTWGLGAYDENNGNEWLCEHYAKLVSTGKSTSCPDCDYAFNTKVNGGATSGSKCADLYYGDMSPAAFGDYAYSDFSFLSAYDGFGFASTYLYAGSYELEDVAFLYGGGSWVPVAFNYPSRGMYYVDVTSGGFDGRSKMKDSSGNGTYYYFAL